MVGIYQIKNQVNNKIYIGSSVNIKQRIAKHYALLRHDRHNNEHLQNAWSKYGEKNFSWSIIELCSEDLLLDLEQWYIDILKPEYNIQPSTTHTIHAKETKIKLSKATSKAFEEGRLRKTTKTIYEYDLAGNFIREWNSLTEAAETLGLFIDKISNCLHGKSRHTKGHRWSLERLPYLPPVKLNGWYGEKAKSQRHYLVKISDEEKLYLFDSNIDAAEYFGCFHGTVSVAIRKQIPFLKKYKAEKLYYYGK